MNLQLPRADSLLPEAEALIVILAFGLAAAIAAVVWLIYLLNTRLARVERLCLGFNAVERAVWPGSERDPPGEVVTFTPHPFAWWRR